MSIYKGYNPIFESLRREVFEAETKSDPGMILKIIYDTFVNILMNSSDPSIKTPEGFKAYFDQLCKNTSIDELKNEIIKKIDSIAQSDKLKKDALDQNKQWISGTIDQLKSAVGDKPENIKSIFSMLSGYVPGTITGLEDLKTHSVQNESLVSQYISEDRRRTGEESETEEGIADKWFTKLSKDMLDAATSFAGETSSASASSQYGSNPQIQDFDKKAQDLLKRAKDLAVSGGRKGLFQMGKIETASGKMSGKDYKVEAQNVVNDVIRTREEFNKLRYKIANVTPPPVNVTVVCPSGFKFDPKTNTCVIAGKIPVVVTNTTTTTTTTDTDRKKPTPTPTPTSSCDFPVSISNKACDNVKSLQEKLMSLGTCIADILNKAGGADGKYGKKTAKITNIVYAYITKSSTFNPEGSLTKEVYDKIMNTVLGTQNSTPPPTFDATAKKESLERKFNDVIFEKEHKTGLSVLPFNEFSTVISEAYYINEDETTPAVSGSPAPAAITITSSLADCICKSYETGQIDSNCFGNVVLPPVPGPTGGTGTTGGTGGTGATGATGAKWKGLKPLRTGIYVIGYDESALSFIGKATIGAVIGVAVIASAGALGALVPAIGGTMAATSTAAGAAASAVAATALPATVASLAGGATFVATSPVLVGVGAISGGAIASGRSNVAVSVAGGFISRQALVKMTRGMIDTLDGRVSDDDMQAIMSTLCVIKGAFTCTVDQTKAVSAWAELKSLYQKKENENLISEIDSIGTLTVSDVENFPDFNSPVGEGSGDMDSDDAKDEIMDAIQRLEANEAKLAENIKDITEEQIQTLIEGTAMVPAGSEGSDEE